MGSRSPLQRPGTMSSLDPTNPVALAQALIRCESVTPADAGALATVEAALERAGFRCHTMTFSEPGTPDIGNLYARRGTAGPNLCFAGHTDVVPAGGTGAWSAPPFGAEIRDGILYGRGAADMKGAIACFIAAASRHGAAHPTHPGSISLLITGDEEGPSINGTVKVLGWLRERDEKLDACLVGEPSNPAALGDERSSRCRRVGVGHLVAIVRAERVVEIVKHNRLSGGQEGAAVALRELTSSVR